MATIKLHWSTFVGNRNLPAERLEYMFNKIVEVEEDELCDHMSQWGHHLSDYEPYVGHLRHVRSYIRNVRLVKMTKDGDDYTLPQWVTDERAQAEEEMQEYITRLKRHNKFTNGNS